MKKENMRASSYMYFILPLYKEYEVTQHLGVYKEYTVCNLITSTIKYSTLYNVAVIHNIATITEK